MDNRIHFTPYSNNRLKTRCLNGSAHALKTTDITRVTCECCLNTDTAKDYWTDYEQKNGNAHRVQEDKKHTRFMLSLKGLLNELGF